MRRLAPLIREFSSSWPQQSIRVIQQAVIIPHHFFQLSLQASHLAVSLQITNNAVHEIHKHFLHVNKSHLFNNDQGYLLIQS